MLRCAFSHPVCCCFSSCPCWVSVSVDKPKAQAGSWEARGCIPESTPGSGRLLAAQPCRWPMEVDRSHLHLGSSLPGSGTACLMCEAKAIICNLVRKSTIRKLKGEYYYPRKIWLKI